jgi:hypothetical protein
VFEEMERALLANAHKHDRMNIDLKSRLDGKGKRQGKEHDSRVVKSPAVNLALFCVAFIL